MFAGIGNKILATTGQFFKKNTEKTAHNQRYADDFIFSLPVIFYLKVRADWSNGFAMSCGDRSDAHSCCATHLGGNCR